MLRQKIAYSCFYSIGKAFDKVQHVSLLRSINADFPRQIQISRKQGSGIFVGKIKNIYSDIKVINAGVSRQSIVSHCYMHSTTRQKQIQTSNATKILMFADITVVLATYFVLKVATSVPRVHTLHISQEQQNLTVENNSEDSYF